ncbi:hypothetical protein [Celeribacter neptunius]|uniref:hypothetical protein n=1 Tax=Celeribacter neptunius TaxID=588602 RepID=UPI000B7D0205|nr:hypothetical protein [Celeribacter neptunius]
MIDQGAQPTRLITGLGQVPEPTATAIVAGGPVSPELLPAVELACRVLFLALALLTALSALFIGRRLAQR